MSQSKELFPTRLEPAPSGSGMLFVETFDDSSSPIICLGKTFVSEEERRAYFIEELRKHLQDPEFRKIEGFPIGKDEDILALSDPPYYTACPNPWLQDFIDEWEKEKEKQNPRGSQSEARNDLPNEMPYHREPFAADVSEGKNDPIYNAHSYHTKVPHKAIMRYILHYTEPGDIVFDGFCGTGMTGVAAQMCGNKTEVESLGYKVQNDGIILQEENNEKGDKVWKPFSRLGARKAVLNDLSPAATFIAYNYNTPVDVTAFEKEAKRILAEVEAECGWMYETLHTDGKTKGKINYTVWSDVFVCPQCSHEVIYLNAVYDKNAGEIKEKFFCPHCSSLLDKQSMESAWITKFDTAMQKTIKQLKQMPVIINYSIRYENHTKRFDKQPDDNDLDILEKIEKLDIPYWYPVNRMMEGGETRRNDPIGVTHVHHFYTKRNLYLLSLLWCKSSIKDRFSLTTFLSRNLTRMNRFIINKYNPRGRINGPFAGTMYIPSEQVEQIATQLYQNKWIDKGWIIKGNVISTESSSKIELKEEVCDYLFLDPPFGANLMYSELNFIWESWLKIFTNNKQEAIMNNTQNKSIRDYRELMTLCFYKAYKMLKKGHWMTVEFSNTHSSVWNAIQSSLSDAGFIVANVAVLDKQHGGQKAMRYTTSVKQDLVISAYKPNGGFEERFVKEADTEEGVWDFIRTHLGYLPVVKTQNNEMQFISERDPRILFDHVVAYYVRKGINIPIVSSQEFQAGLKKRFDERDGMYFLHEQVLEYDKKKLLTGGLKQSELFVLNEETAIQWLKSLLDQKPQTLQDIHPKFMQEIAGWDKKEKQIELRTLLEENFIDDDSGKWHVPDPQNAAHIEKMREKALLKEFEEYKNAAKRLKVFRIEAIRAGFKKAYNDHDYETIIKVASKLQGDIIEEDPKLLMWYSNTRTRMGKD